MSRRASRYLTYFALLAACVFQAACQGAPSGFNQVSLATGTPVVLQNGTAVITATVAQDTNNGGVSWTLTGVGTLSGATKTSVTYTAPASVTAEKTVSVNATAVDFPTQTKSIQITLEPGVTVTTTSLSSGNYGSPYSAAVNATGGVPPLTWSISAGSLTPGLGLGASNSRSVIISGTPTQQVNSNFTIKATDATGAFSTQPLTITIGAPLPLAVSTTTLPTAALNAAYPNTTLQATGGVPPFSWSLFSGSLPPGINLASDGALSGTPTVAGTYTFKVQVQDSETLPMMATSATLTITVQNLGIVSGNYAFAFNGFNSTGNPVAVVGSFNADGAGNLTNGVEDVNAIGTTPVNRTFTGTYTLDAENRGLITFSSLTPAPAYSFAINGSGSHGRLIEFDGSGTRGSGDLEKRTLSTCTDTTFSGNYAFGLSGQQIAVSGVSAAGPDVIVGAFTAGGAVSPSTTGSIGPGELDANTPVKVTTQDQTLTGTYKATTQATRCSLTISSTLQTTMNFSVYPVSSTQALMVETDAVGASTPILTSGTIQEQFGAPFSATPGSTFTGTSVGALTGRAPSGSTFLPDVAVVAITGTGSSSFTYAATENTAGAVTNPSGAASFQEADIYGRVSTNLVQPFGPTFYMISQNTAFLIGEDQSQTSQPYPFFGVVQPQATGPFTAADIASISSFVESTGAPPVAAVQNAAGAIVFVDTNATTGRVGGLQDQSTSLVNTAGETVTGAYTVVNSTAGTGTVAFTAPTTATASFIVISPTEIVMVTTTAGDANPMILLLQQ